ncbi:phage head-tail adaptor family protein, putative [Ichthyophthirius multifiliis]|uniref:Phage head-tail adaptor family protein, putative n=1 Tax=Ichthyophthirius multifiliis TaxID=5932 RepID=G0QZG7_ICHMU|nr:phage head-tail adaptor family protein, putative [Ichthyophthirius multifiliis]EGR29391.1 phage head-tail adaptor family protein, putative [Ichthyophthirius multifiliis]|eukprot:XP_004030627.1 phage head-tail adaptor family protein, putative [Ichthyophthirius multifiliis]
MKVDETWITVAYILGRGEFTLIRDYAKNIYGLQYPTNSYPSTEYQQPKPYLAQCTLTNENDFHSLIVGITGIISSRLSNIKPTQVLYNIYKNISMKMKKDQQQKYDESLNNIDKLKKGNTLDYAIYQLTKSTYLSPMWTLLILGDFNTWEYLAQTHFMINNSKITYLNPIKALVLIINFLNFPTILKEVTVNNEYIMILKVIRESFLDSQKIINKNSKKKNINTDIDIKNEEDNKNEEKKNEEEQEKEIEQEEKKQQIEDDLLQYLTEKLCPDIQKRQLEILDSFEIYDPMKLNEMARNVNFPTNIIQMLVQYYNQYTKKELEQKKQKQKGRKEKEQEQKEYQEGNQQEIKYLLTDEILLQVMIENDLQNQNEYEQIYDIIIKVFKQINTYFYTDPRIEKNDQIYEYIKYNNKQKKFKFTQQNCNFVMNQNPIMQLNVLTSLYQLKRCYWDIFGYADREDDHSKQVSFLIDFLLSTIEKYYFYDDMIDYFSKFRLIQIIGLACGFTLTTDDILRSNPTESLYNYNYQQVMVQLYEWCQDKNINDKLSLESNKSKIAIQKFKLKQNYYFELLAKDIISTYDQYGSMSKKLGFFKDFLDEDIITCIQNNTMEYLIDNFEDYIDSYVSYQYQEFKIFYDLQDSTQFLNYRKREGYYDNYDLEQTDFQCGAKNKDVINQQDKFQEMTQNDNFVLLVDIFRENYQALNMHEFFMENYSQECNFYFGVLLLNGAILQDRGEIQFDNMISCLSASTQFMVSNKKVLAEILCLYLSSIYQPFQALLDETCSEGKDKILHSFISLAMDKSLDPKSDLDRILSISNLTDINRHVVQNIKLFYEGNMNECLKLVQYSEVFQYCPTALQYLQKFLWSFEKPKDISILKNIQLTNALTELNESLMKKGYKEQLNDEEQLKRKEKFISVVFIDSIFSIDSSILNVEIEEKPKQSHKNKNQIFNSKITSVKQTNQIGYTMSQILQNQKQQGLNKTQKNQLSKEIEDIIIIVAKDIFNANESILSLIHALFYLITNQKPEILKHNTISSTQDSIRVLIQFAFENEDLKQFFFGKASKSDDGAQIEKMISNIFILLQSIFERPQQSLNDPYVVQEVMKLLKYISKGQIDCTIIEDIISIVQGDYQKIFVVIKKFDILDQNKINLINKIYDQVSSMGVFQDKDKLTNIGKQSQAPLSDKMKDLIKKLKEGKVQIADIFYAVDKEGDGNGSISKDEFSNFIKRLGMELTIHRINEIFAAIKNNKKSKHKMIQNELNEDSLNQDEFEQAFKYLNDKKTSMTLEKLGISPALLAIALGTLIIILILLLVFIFLGISAFALGGTFGAIINSIIPMSAAGGAASSQEDKTKQLKEDNLKDAVNETQEILHSNQL